MSMSTSGNDGIGRSLAGTALALALALATVMRKSATNDGIVTGSLPFNSPAPFQVPHSLY